MKHFYHIFRLLRPRQWLKNFALFSSIVFTGQFFNTPILTKVILGFISFCLLSSASYVVNDIFDAEKDRLHPFKKGRPIASGKVSIKEGIFVFVVLLAISFVFAQKIGSLFLPIWVVFFLIQLSYSLFFKNMVIFDILFIAAGYIVRVLAGEVISSFHISAWLLLTTISLSLFLGVGKRRSELTLLKNFTGARVDQVRKSLSHYSENMLDIFSSMFATSTFVFYSLFTFLENPRGIKISLDLFLPDFLPPYLQRKWLMITILPVIYGLMRYLEDVHEKSEGESPEKVLLSDKYLLAAVLIWVVLVFFVIYFLSQQ